MRDTPTPLIPVPPARTVTRHFARITCPDASGCAVRDLEIAVYNCAEVDPLLTALAEQEQEIARLKASLAERPA